ncbi:hypothetical protein IFM89_027353 [Coptis chinensis]|uniref:Pentatricopeptide repeat-containing protein n=1 Tax=Coptis chinensis TaxID=261450 RepID=A0A835LKM9_9MAGN|nr:hypothetical protein IFM89_027353 [Coptis chinensis]
MSLDGDIYGSIINGYLRRNEVSKAFDMFRDMKESGILLKLPHYNKACKLYDEMLESGIHPDIMAMTTLVAVIFVTIMLSEAFKVFESMKEKGFSVSQKF